MKKILITGGACAGKTTSLNLIKEYFEKNNYKVYVMEEVPTKLIYEGITSDKIVTSDAYILFYKRKNW